MCAVPLALSRVSLLYDDAPTPMEAPVLQMPSMRIK